jgi:hypothetical protein
MSGQTFNANQGWKVERSITVGHIVAACAFIAAGFTAYSTTSNDIQRNAQSIAHMEQRLNDQAEYAKAVRSEFQGEIALLRRDFNSEIKVVNAKLDRLIERELKR